MALLELLCLPVPYDQTHPAAHALLNHPHLRWGDLIELAVDHKMLCLLADYLTRTGLSTEQEPRRTRFLERQLRLNQHSLRHHRANAARITRTFCDAGVPFVATSGIAVESTLYHGRGERPLSDIDITIESTRQAAAGQALAALGYQPAGTDRCTARTYIRTSADPLIPRIVVDLNQQVVDGADSPHQLVADIIGRRTTQAIPGHQEPLAVPTRVDHAVLATLAFRARERQPRRVTLLACADLLRLWRQVIQGDGSDTARQTITRYGIQTAIAEVTGRLDSAFRTTITAELDLGALVKSARAPTTLELPALLYDSHAKR
jgi:hypothetical protein